MPGVAVIVALLRRDGRRTRERIYRSRTNIFQMGESEVYRLFRFTPNIILELATALDEELNSPTRRSLALSPLVKVLATLHFLASGTFQRTSGVVAGLSQSSLSRCVHQVVPAILTLMNQYIIKPTDETLRQKIMLDFYAVAGFPRTIGAIDCTHVALRPPAATEHVYRNRKQWHSINVQVIADASCLIWHVRAKHPGSSHDSYIYRISNIPDEFQQNMYKDSWLLGKHEKTPQRLRCR